MKWNTQLRQAIPISMFKVFQTHLNSDQSTAETHAGRKARFLIASLVICASSRLARAHRLIGGTALRGRNLHPIAPCAIGSTLLLFPPWPRSCGTAMNDFLFQLKIATTTVGLAASSRPRRLPMRLLPPAACSFRLIRPPVRSKLLRRLAVGAPPLRRQASCLAACGPLTPLWSLCRMAPALEP